MEAIKVVRVWSMWSLTGGCRPQSVYPRKEQVWTPLLVFTDSWWEDSEKTEPGSAQYCTVVVFKMKKLNTRNTIQILEKTFHHKGDRIPAQVV